MKFADFDKKFSRYLFGEEISKLLPNINFDDSLPVVQNLTFFHNYIVTNTERSNWDSLSREKRFGAENPIIIKQMAIEALLDVVLSSNKHVSLTLGNKLISRADSFNRPKLILKFHGCMKEKDWLRCFFVNWTGFDGCSLYTNEIKEKLQFVDPENVMKNIFSKADYKKWLCANDEIVVYRGAFESFKDGLSWSTDIEIARKFANTYIDMKNKGLSYYRAMCQMSDAELKLFTDRFSDDVSIFSMIVKKKDCIFINDRSENEVFIPKSHLYDIKDYLQQ